jgi:pimeloyl-[acyl-carrier protein] methyl ester esterase
MQAAAAGTGPDVVLLHGWGMRASVWVELAALLTANFRVHNVELSAASRPSALDAMVDAIAAASARRVSVCGWSMGGQLALHWAATHAGQVARLVLIATTPCFVRGPDWEHGMEGAVFDGFAHDLAQDADGTLQRFALLQARGDTSARKVARHLQACTAGTGTSEQAALVGGLELLRTTDLRSTLPVIAQPALIVHGEHDAVVPLRAGEYLQRNLPQAELAVIEGAAHAPFIAQPRAVAQRIAKFCHG